MIIDHPVSGWESQLRRLWQTTFGDTDAFLDSFFATAYAPSRCLCAREEDKLVAAVYWFGCTCRNRPVAYLYALAVDETCRGQGIGTRFMEKVHAVLEAQGYAGVLLVPQQPRLQTLYARLGYKNGPGVVEWHSRAGEQSLFLKPLDGLTYGAIRRKYLPEGGVVQEGENLHFLQTQATFWTGKDFICAVCREGNSAKCLEILGNCQAAPGILRTLGCTEGSFRTFTSTEEQDFTMFRPLGEDPVSDPEWFAFAFD